MSKHTPGPWAVKGQEIWAANTNVADAWRAYGDLDGDSFIELDCETATANARLIAAAPDLLAALEWIAGSGRPASELTETARAAIAKAKGE